MLQHKNKNKFKFVLLLGITISLATQAKTTNLIESFDDVNTLPSNGWVFDNRSDFATKVDWAQGIASLFPAHSGTATSYIFNTTASGGNLVCNWLIMPDIGAIEQLSFYTRSDNQANEVTRMKVMYSPSGSINTGGCSNAPNAKGSLDLGDFNTLLTINPNQSAGAYPQDWTQYTVDVNGTGRIAFLYYVDTGAPNFNSGTLAIDTITRRAVTSVNSIQTIPTLSIYGLLLLVVLVLFWAYSTERKLKQKWK